MMMTPRAMLIAAVCVQLAACQMATSEEFDVSVEEDNASGLPEESLTLDEKVSGVEKYLKSHPELPSLTREEIIGYINNISDSEHKDKEEEGRFMMSMLPPKPVNVAKSSSSQENSDLEDFIIGGEDPIKLPRKEGQFVREVYGYPVYTPTTDDYIVTTDADVKYTNYKNPEMITKKYHFEESQKESEEGQLSNHRYGGNEEEGSVERINGTIVVLPVKNHNYGSGDFQTTTAKPRKPFLKKRIKTSTAKPIKFQESDSLENFGLEDDPPKVNQKFRKGLKSKATTEGPPGPEDVTKIMEILPPGMKDLLKNLGLNNPVVIEEITRGNEGPPQPVIDPKSYSAFRPLPLARKSDKKFADDGMREFLASFGLVQDEDGKSRRRQKSLEPVREPKFLEEVPEVSLEIIPEEMRHVLHDLGLGGHKAKPSRDHIFNPSSYSVSQSKEQTEKLKALMANIKKVVSMNDSEPVSEELQQSITQQIKELDNLTTEFRNTQTTQINNEIKQILMINKEKFSFVFNNVTDDRSNEFDEGPNPLLLFEEPQFKNEVKRQVSSSSSSNSSASSSSDASAGVSSSSSSSSSDSGSDATTTEEPPNIEGLKESFGGGGIAPDDVDVKVNLPPKKPNGLYFLVDWNSFLEVGTEDDKRKVNIRFQPKVGDGRHFIPVTIP